VISSEHVVQDRGLHGHQGGGNEGQSRCPGSSRSWQSKWWCRGVHEATSRLALKSRARPHRRHGAAGDTQIIKSSVRSQEMFGYATDYVRGRSGRGVALCTSARRAGSARESADEIVSKVKGNYEIRRLANFLMATAKFDRRKAHENIGTIGTHRSWQDDRPTAITKCMAKTIRR